MRKTIPSKMQVNVMGGSLNLVPMTYKISDTPVGDEERWGILSYVTKETREKIIGSGFGEMSLHIEHIKLSIGYIKKMRQRLPDNQISMKL